MDITKLKSKMEPSLENVIRHAWIKKSIADKQASNVLDKSHCKEAIASFRERIITTIHDSPDHEKIIRIPFPLPCGSFVTQLLEKENISHHVAIHTNINESNELVLHFNPYQFNVNAMLSKMLSLL